MFNKIKQIYLELFDKRYQIVAYNNRMYKGFRFIVFTPLTLHNAKEWIKNNGDENKYIYDFYDIKTHKMLYNFSDMFKNYYYIKKVIKNDENKYKHTDVLKKYIFAFKNKWSNIFNENVPKIYFEDLMTIYNDRMEK